MKIHAGHNWNLIPHLMHPSQPEQDWTTVVWKKQPARPASETVHVANAPGTKRFRQLDSNEPPPPPSSSLSLRVSMQRARHAKQMSQADLAKALNVRPGVIHDYEAGSLNPPPHHIAAMSRILGTKLVNETSTRRNI